MHEDEAPLQGVEQPRRRLVGAADGLGVGRPAARQITNSAQPPHLLQVVLTRYIYIFTSQACLKEFKTEKCPKYNTDVSKQYQMINIVKRNDDKICSYQTTAKTVNLHFSHRLWSDGSKQLF